VITRDDLAARDAADPLASFRDAYVLPDGLIYLDGNSLGALPHEARARLHDVIDREWGRDLIRSWTKNDWIGLPARVGDKIGRLIGAAPGQTVAADSISVNLFKLLAAALQLRPGRTTIVTEEGNFPTDLYIAQGLTGMIERLGGPAFQIRYADPLDIPAALDDDVAVVMLTHVDFKSGRNHDMAAVTAAAHLHGAVMLWDLSHSAGAVPVELDGCNADMAVGCGYKYLNGGPGAPAFLYVAERHHDAIDPALAGWMGHAAPFEFSPDYRPAPGIARMLVGTPPVLSMAALEIGVDGLIAADMDRLRTKSLALTGTFMDLVEQELGDAFGIMTPRGEHDRGSQVSLTHRHGYAIARALIDRGVIPDFRAPDVLRLGFTPLYLRFVDLWDAVAILKDIMDSHAWDRADYKVRAAVT